VRTAVLLVMALCLQASALAHSGGLDKNGGHMDRRTGTYHYHSGGGNGGMGIIGDLPPVEWPRVPRGSAGQEPRTKPRLVPPVGRTKARPPVDPEQRQLDPCDVESRDRIAGVKVRLAEEIAAAGNTTSAARRAREIIDECGESHATLRAAAILKQSRTDPSSPKFEGQVIAVLDGDILVVLGPSKLEYRVRLAGIDAPEPCQPFGIDAKEALGNLALGEKVSVEWRSRDKYERIIGIVRLPKLNLSLRMVEDGWAWQYPKTDQDRDIQQAEAAARDAKRGLWQQENPEPPWEFKQRARTALHVSGRF
jgi:endonuclease YncB( thermonuclease family)